MSTAPKTRRPALHPTQETYARARAASEPDHLDPPRRDGLPPLADAGEEVRVTAVKKLAERAKKLESQRETIVAQRRARVRSGKGTAADERVLRAYAPVRRF